MQIDHGAAVPFDIENKALSEDGDCFVLRGYASTWGNEDLGRDIVVRGAFTRSLREKMPVLLWMHKHDDVPVGSIVEAVENEKGLHITAELPKDDQFVRGRLAPQIRRRSLKGLSIGFTIAPGGSERRQDGVRSLKQLRLHEISIVSTR